MVLMTCMLAAFTTFVVNEDNDHFFKPESPCCCLYDQQQPVGLPELMTSFDGRRIASVEDWETVRRPELVDFFTRNVYGVRPVEKPANLKFRGYGGAEPVLGGRAFRQHMIGEFSGPRGNWEFNFYVYLPAKASAEKPVGAFLLICNRALAQYADPYRTTESEFFPVGEIVGRGYAAIVFKNTEFGLDGDEYRPKLRADGSAEIPDPDFREGFYARWAEQRSEDSWGAISSWAWGASRILDWIETEPRLDAKHVAVVGHSRGGKTALWAAANDPRFAMACVNDSGCCGAKLNHVAVPLSETIAQDNNNNPHWFARTYRKFNGHDFVLPFDQHWLAALVAPRLLCIASASEDAGAGPWGEFLTARHASPVWALYGKKGLVEDHAYAVEKPFQEGEVGYHLRRGGHDLTLYDWQRYLDFADRHGWPRYAGPAPEPVPDVRPPAKQARATVEWVRTIYDPKDRYVGWPTVAALKDGTLIAVFSGDREDHICPFGKVMAVRSTDDGETWSAPITVADTSLDDRDAGVVQLPNGEVMVTYFTSVCYRYYLANEVSRDSPRFAWKQTSAAITPDDERRYLGWLGVFSSDGGLTWSEPHNNCVRGDTPHNPTVCADGSLFALLYEGSNVRPRRQTQVYGWRSADNGRSWQCVGGPVPDRNGENDMNDGFEEPAVAACADGSLLGLIRYGHADRHLRMTRSRDGGKTWSPARRTEILGFPAHLLKLGDGRLVCSYGRREPGDYGEYAAISEDNGETWDVAHEIQLARGFQADLGYPSTCVCRDGSLLTVYYQKPDTDSRCSLMATKWRFNRTASEVKGEK